MKYKTIVSSVETTDGVEYIAEIPSVPGCIGGGKTKSQAIKDLESNLKAHLKYCIKNEIRVLDSEAENNYYLRSIFSPSLINKLVQKAEQEGTDIKGLIESKMIKYLFGDDILVNVVNAIKKQNSRIYDNRSESLTNFLINNMFVNKGEN